MEIEQTIVQTAKGKVNVSASIRKYIEVTGVASHQEVAAGVSQLIGKKVLPSTVAFAIRSGEYWAQVRSRRR